MKAHPLHGGCNADSINADSAAYKETFLNLLHKING